MAVRTSCPDPDQLRQFLLGQSPQAELDTLERHLRQCSRCQQIVEALKTDDTLCRLVSEDLPTAGSGTGLGKKQKKTSGLQQAPTVPLPPSRPENQPRPSASPGRPDSDSNFAFLAPAQAPDELGRLGNYRVLKVIGRGGMGVVFQAEDVRLQRPVALKVILPEIAEKRSARERFLREARASAKIEHDNIVAIYQVDEDRGVPYMAMPLLKGASLEDFLRQRARKQPGSPLALHEILKIGRETAKGLAAAHERGLIHRDIKPANLWLDAGAGGRVKILDFGLARPTSAEDGNLTQAGTIVGTPAYMAPEQSQGYPVDARADLFSLGVVLYRLCTGNLPFTGANALDIIMALATYEPPPPITVNPKLPPELSDLVMRLLVKKPDQRLASAQEVLKALQAIEKAVRSGASVPELARIGPAGSQPFALPAPPSPPDSGEETLVANLKPGSGLRPALRQQPEAPPRARSKGGMMVVALLLFVLVGGAAYLGLNILAGKDRGTPTTSNDSRTDGGLVNSLGMKLVRIPAGKFLMGSPASELGRATDEDQHEVAITRPFLMGAHEVTVGQFKAFVKETNHRTEAEISGGGLGPTDSGTKNPKITWQAPGFDQTDDHPVVCVSWNDAVAFCAWLTKKEGKKYALPTESQWEYACRAGLKGPFGFGDDSALVDLHAWFAANSGMKTRPVGQKKPNAWGLYDMHGNAREWTASWYSFYRKSPQPLEDPTGPVHGVCRALRGGSWFDSSQYLRSAQRIGRCLPEECNITTGFRVVREAEDGLAPASLPPVHLWTTLFNGKNLAGWSVPTGGHGNWKVQNGAITCTGPASYLYSDREYDNFHLHVVSRINHGGNSGVFFRALLKPMGIPDGYEAQINSTDKDPEKTGSLYLLSPFKESLVPPDTWFFMDIIAKGKNIQIMVNSRKVVDYNEKGGGRTRGRLALQHLGTKTTVHFSKIEIREVTP
jgi:formylglycine-generating enzyme required for sulfatase activity/serine/threonine protein kinase